MKLKKEYIIIGILLIIILLLMKSCDSSLKIAGENKALMEALNDTVEVWKDKDGLNHTKITQLQTENIKSFTELKNQSEEIQKLQEEVSKYKKQIRNGGSVTIYETITKFDTTYIDNSLPPELKGIDLTRSITNEYIHSEFGWKSDTAFFSLRVKDNYTTVIGQERVNFFKVKPYVEVINHSPYTELSYLRSYKQEERIKRFNFGFYAGYGIGIDLKPQPQIGLGIMYSLKRF